MGCIKSRDCFSANQILFSFRQATRRAIEESGREARWEFSVQRQFGHVGHAADVCSDVAAVTDVLSQLQFCFTDNLVACTKLPRSAGAPNFFCTIFGSAARMFLDSSVGTMEAK